jgi:hypothetical protein
MRLCQRELTETLRFVHWVSPVPHLRMKIDLASETLYSFVFLEHQTMDEAQNSNNPGCHTRSSQCFTVYKGFVSTTTYSASYSCSSTTIGYFKPVLSFGTYFHLPLRLHTSLLPVLVTLQIMSSCMQAAAADSLELPDHDIREKQTCATRVAPRSIHVCCNLCSDVRSRALITDNLKITGQWDSV